MNDYSRIVNTKSHPIKLLIEEELFCLRCVSLLDRNELGLDYTIKTKLN